MAEATITYHPRGSRGFVADAGKSVREVVVKDVILLMSMDGTSPRHVVEAVDGAGELWHDQFPFSRIHVDRDAAAAELAGYREILATRVVSRTPLPTALDG